ncbi:nicotinate-nucleotide--dimethylbenzimidazole phosphoribosyltransferase [Loigolactobacillus jiayinensis]|uniref:Nicotinate-nucleotide--dimethylbenzimidazole phosphoribosyltransferase n=1 Tax=Loigolactobacillus jiayinensis TaxID=2486016 RepID=A0ABW1R8X2_9LACO|nr:nicotinate-nucleotide--dimethylbenzimidazole phosphoribosyltransferase [Loigolactobacillus jiayinensis]
MQTIQVNKPYQLPPLADQAAQAMQEIMNGLAKPVASLGRLEELAVRLARIEATTKLRLQHKTLLVFAADHGVTVEHVSATPKKVTIVQAGNMLAGHTAVAALAQAAHCHVQVIDIGIDSAHTFPGLIDAKIAYGTHNIALGPAMTRAQALQAIKIGYATAVAAINAGSDILAVGELGVGNTTTAAAVAAACLQCPATEVVGRGSNIADAKFKHKIAIVQQSLKINQPDTDDAIDILAKVGGFEFGGKVGAMLAAAEHQTPLILDGFISYAAALLAQKIAPTITDYLVPSHVSHEQGSKRALQQLRLQPYFDLNLCVGEGTGAVMLMPWLDELNAILTQMNTLADMDIIYKH